MTSAALKSRDRQFARFLRSAARPGGAEPRRTLRLGLCSTPRPHHCSPTEQLRPCSRHARGHACGEVAARVRPFWGTMGCDRAGNSKSALVHLGLHLRMSTGDMRCAPSDRQRRVTCVAWMMHVCVCVGPGGLCVWRSGTTKRLPNVAPRRPVLSFPLRR